MENKPFIFGVATSGDNFTDREKETERLLLNFQHGVNTVLISPRRWVRLRWCRKYFVWFNPINSKSCILIFSRISPKILFPTSGMRHPKKLFQIK